MPILSDIYSAGNTLKRRIGGLLDDPNGSLEQFVGQLRDDMNRNSDLMNQAGWGQIDRVKYTPEQRAAAQKKLADIGTNMAMSAATVWHGSPHKFDKFDASKIGTGEGAQAYGHGLYLAESPAVASAYKRNLGGLEMRDKSGAVLPIPENVQWVAKDLAEAGGNYSMVRKQLAEHGKSYPWPAQVGTKYIDELEAAGAKPSELGSLYKVDLPDDQIAKMLDWDKPLSQQPKEVQKAIRSQMPENAWNVMKDRRGQDYVEHYWNGGIGGSGQSHFASSRMNDLGIPGIRYLDGGSRGTGQGTSNFVVFPGNEGILKILERNGQPLGLLGD